MISLESISGAWASAAPAASAADAGTTATVAKPDAIVEEITVTDQKRSHIDPGNDFLADGAAASNHGTPRTYGIRSAYTYQSAANEMQHPRSDK